MPDIPVTYELSNAFFLGGVLMFIAFCWASYERLKQALDSNSLTFQTALPVVAGALGFCLILAGSPDRFNPSEYATEFAVETEVRDDFREALQQRQQSVAPLSDEELLQQREAARAADNARYNPTSIEETRERLGLSPLEGSGE